MRSDAAILLSLKSRLFVYVDMDLLVVAMGKLPTVKTFTSVYHVDKM